MVRQIQDFVLKWRFPLLIVIFASGVLGMLFALATQAEWAYLLDFVSGLLLFVYLATVRWALNSRYPKNWREHALFTEKAPWRRTATTMPGIQFALTDQSLLYFPHSLFAFPAVLLQEFVVPYSRVYHVKAADEQIGIVFHDDRGALQEVTWGGKSVAKIVEILQQKCPNASFQLPPYTFRSWVLHRLPWLLLFVSVIGFLYATMMLVPLGPVNNAANNPPNHTLVACGLFVMVAVGLIAANWMNKYRLRNGF